MPKASTFYTSLGLLVILNILVKPLWIFGIDRQVQNIVGTIEYGHYFSLFGLSVVLSFLLDWGFTSYYHRQLATKQAGFLAQAGNFFLIKISFSLFYAILLVTVAVLTDIHRWDIVAGVVLIQVMSSLFIFLRAIITAEQWFRTEAWVSVLDKTLMIIFCGAFIFFPSLAGSINLHRFMFFQVLSTTIASLVVLLILYRNGINFKLRAFSSFFTRQLLIDALPYGTILLLMAIHFRLDGFLLERIHPNGPSEAGVYAAAYRLLDAANMVGVLFASFVLPYVARQWSLQQAITPVILSVRHLLVLFSIAISCSAIFLAPWISSLLYHQENAYTIEIIQWCLPSLVGYALVSVYGTVLTATGHIYTFCGITFAAVLINILLNSLLIPLSGAKGCCIAAICSQLACGLATMGYVKLKLQVQIHVYSLVIYLLFAAILAGFLYLMHQLNTNPWLTISGVALLTIGLSLVSKLITIRNWKQLLKLGVSVN